MRLWEGVKLTKSESVYFIQCVNFFMFHGCGFGQVGDLVAVRKKYKAEHPAGYACLIELVRNYESLHGKAHVHTMSAVQLSLYMGSRKLYKWLQKDDPVIGRKAWLPNESIWNLELEGATG